MADLGVHAALNDDAPPSAVGNDGAHIGAVVAVAQRRVGRQLPTGVLVHRHRLAGKRRLLNPQVDALHQPQVSGDIVTGLKHHQVTRRQFAGGDRDLVAIADDFGLRRGQLFKSGQRLLCLTFLHHTNNGVKDNNGHDGPAIQPLAQHKRD